MERRSFTLAAVGALLAGFPLLAHAQGQRQAPNQGLGDLLNLRPSPGAGQQPLVARYLAENVAFTFDRTSSTVRFDGASEIIVLARQAAPRGDTLYVNDLGEPVLRVSGLGGMTLFTRERPQGIPVAFVSGAAPLRLEGLRPGVDMSFWMQSVSSRITRLMGMRRQVAILVDIEPRTSLTLVADAITLAEQAFRRNAERPRLREKMEHIDTILVRDDGPAPSVRVQGDVLEIVIAPAKGVAGRPSSEKIARALGR